MNARNPRFVMNNALSEHQFPVGNSVDVRVSCLESPAKFWCQMKQDSDTLFHLMQDIQRYYASDTQDPVEPICIARHPDGGTWYRAKLIESRPSPLVEVRFIDYGHTQMVGLRDLLPIDPGFLKLHAQAFPCCLHNVNHPAGSVPPWSDFAAVEFQAFLDAADTSELGLKCTVKDVVRDPQGLATLNVVDIETQFQSACKVLAQKGATQAEVPTKVRPPPGMSDAYAYSTHGVEVGGEEKVLITCSEGVGLFYCQLHRNSHLFDELMEDIQRLCRRPQSRDPPLALNSLCFAKYTDNRWYRGRITATRPVLVHFVDYGETVEVNKPDILPFPVNAGNVRSVPVQAIPLELYKMPADVSQEVNDWFWDHSTGHNYTISVVAKDSSGKLTVELYDGPLNVNVMIRERIAKARPRKEAGLVQQTDRRPSRSSDKTISNVPREACGQTTPHVAMPELGVEPAVDDQRKQARRNVRINDLPPKLMRPGLVAEVYISHFNSPSSFFVQLKMEEDDVSCLVEKLNECQPFCNTPVEFGDLQIGDLVNAEYPVDCSWYRAVVRGKSADRTARVEFIDFGNEATCPSLKICRLDQQFTERPRFSIPCILAGVANQIERWNKEAISIFQHATSENPEKTFACTFIRDGEDVWEVSLEDQGILLAETFVNGGQTKDKGIASAAEALAKGGQMECTHVTQLDFPEENVTICRYKEPNISPHETDEVYASSIVGPHYFWCQHAKSEELNQISRLVQEVGSAESQDAIRIETLGAGSPCLALFAEDKMWYRARVIRKADNVLTVLFVDYGNESEVDVKNVKSIPPALLEKAPQAFLCSLAGFDEGKGTWHEDALDEFYDLLVDKLLSVTSLKMEDNTASQIPQYIVKMACGGVIVNCLMEKHWRASTAESHASQ